MDCCRGVCCRDIGWIRWSFSEDVIERVARVLWWWSKGSVSKNSCWIDGSRGRCLLICRGCVCWLRHLRVEVLLEGLLLCFGLFDERLDVVFWFWVGGRGSRSELWEGGLLRGSSFKRDAGVLFTVLSWDGDGLFWHMLGWRSKIAWTSSLLVSSLIGWVNIGSRKCSRRESWDNEVNSVPVVRLLSSVVHVWPDDVDIVDVLSTITTLSWL